ncbi:MAG: hypothetical protein A3H35_04400 [Betaproteobacteria bacterium RIFCSPLOWO2_02_FULL_62_17]|nr:MAG: hypothetical protein A3H35_04400 [Betaproteobacteria bacterium RIFCSPLOWO2_02_FULL_62_17]
MIERIFEVLMRSIERLLAIAFVFAVCLNFVDVIGRYVFGRTLSWGDEVQVYIMMAMTFLGAAIVTWRQLHLRMDILVRGLRGRARIALMSIEILVILVLAGFVMVRSTLYALRIFEVGQTSDIGTPMWIPHSAVALGFGLIAAVTLWRGMELIRGRQSARADSGDARI